MDLSYGLFTINLLIRFFLLPGEELLGSFGHSILKHIVDIYTQLPMEAFLEKRCFKFILSYINSSNRVVRSLTLSALNHSYSTLGEKYRYLSYKIW